MLHGLVKCVPGYLELCFLTVLGLISCLKQELGPNVRNYLFIYSFICLFNTFLLLYASIIQESKATPFPFFPSSLPPSLSFFTTTDTQQQLHFLQLLMDSKQRQ